MQRIDGGKGADGLERIQISGARIGQQLDELAMPNAYPIAPREPSLHNIPTMDSAKALLTTR